jgi:hypothetical protein
MVAYLSSLPEQGREQHATFLKLVTDYIRLIKQDFIQLEESAKNAVNIHELALDIPVL